MIEKAVISLAVKMDIKRVLIDEAKARIVARFNGLCPRGTLGILWNAFKDGVIDKKTLELTTLDLNIPDECSHSGIKHFIYFSSVKAMAEERADNLDETYSPSPETPYGKRD